MKITGDLKERLGAEFVSKDDYVPRILYRQAADKTVANTVTETTLITTTGALGTVTIPANYLSVGRTIRISVWGHYSTAGSAVNMTLRPKFGGTNYRVSAANAMTVSMSARPWKFEFLFTCQTAGASGTIQGQALATFSTGAITAAIWDMGGSNTLTWDTTASRAFDLTTQWSAAVLGHTITCTNVLIESF